MTNILSNYFKDKYLNLQKDSNLNPTNFKLNKNENNHLKDKIKNFYKFSYSYKQYNTNFSNNKIMLISKNQSDLIREVSIKKTTSFLNLSPLFHKGSNLLHITPKVKNTASLFKLIAFKNLSKPFKGYSNFSFSSILPQKDLKNKILNKSLTSLNKNKDIQNLTTETSGLNQSKEQSNITYKTSLKRGVQRTPKGWRFLENKKNKQKIKEKLESSINPRVEQLLLKYWNKRWLNKKKQYSELSTYVLQVSDKQWFSVLEKIRQSIKSKYVFNSFLSSSHLVNYTFNKNSKFNLLFYTSIYKILKYFFSSLSALISKPIFILSPNKLNIQLFYYIIPPFSKLKRERNIKNIIKYKGKLNEEKKNKRELKKIMKTFKMKAFISKWKENNNLIHLPSLTNSFSYSPDNNFSLSENSNLISYENNLNNLPNISFTFEQAKNREISTMISLNKDKLKYLVFILEKFLKKTVILDLIKLKYPYHNSNILAQVLGLSSKRKNFRWMIRTLLYTATIKNPKKLIRKQNFSIIPSYLSGIKIKLAGRLITQRVIPRFTVQNFQMGSLARGKINYVDSSRFTHKNKRGAFSFTVTTGHIF